MNIAVNTRTLKKNITGNDIEQMLIKFARSNSLHNFFFFTNSTIAEATNIVSILNKPLSNALSLKFWSTLKLPSLLKKNNASILINTHLAKNINTPIPQLQIIETLTDRGLSKKNIIDVLKNSRSIIATSQFIKEQIIKQYKIADEKIVVLYLTPTKKFIPIDWHRKQDILKKYSAEKEYFLFHAKDHTPNELLDLLKAFSIFKKWQKSNLQLIIADKEHSLTPSFIISLKTYKYREEVIILNCDADQLAEITAAAYCIIDLNKKNAYIHLLEAFQCNAPVITTNNELNKEICGDAALYALENNFSDLAQKMILIYKDENTRNGLITNGVAQKKLFEAEANLLVLNNAIEKAFQA